MKGALVLAIVIFVGLFWLHKSQERSCDKPCDRLCDKPPETRFPSEIQVIVSEDYTDTLKNVYAPPVQYRETEFRQVGYLTNHHRLPLFGRILNRRDKWAYYTMEQGIKLPIEFNRRKCTQSPGCDSLSTGDEVLVEGIPYRVELYESFLSAY